MLFYVIWQISEAVCFSIISYLLGYRRLKCMNINVSLFFTVKTCGDYPQHIHVGDIAMGPKCVYHPWNPDPSILVYAWHLFFDICHLEFNMIWSLSTKAKPSSAAVFFLSVDSILELLVAQMPQLYSRHQSCLSYSLFCEVFQPSGSVLTTVGASWYSPCTLWSGHTIPLIIIPIQQTYPAVCPCSFLNLIFKWLLNPRYLFC